MKTLAIAGLLALLLAPASAPRELPGGPPEVRVGTVLRLEDQAEHYRVQCLSGDWILVRRYEASRSVGRSLDDEPRTWVNLGVMRSYEVVR